MKRNLNTKITNRAGVELNGQDGKALTYADVIVASLDAFGGQGVGKRAIGKLADEIMAAKKPPKVMDVSPEDVKLIDAALEAGPYVSIVCKQIMEYLEAK